MLTRAQEYAAKVKELIANAKSLSPEAARAVEELLKDANRRILSKLAELGDPKSYTSTQLQSMLRQIDDAMARFRVDATRSINGMQEHAAIVASKDISATVAAGLGQGVSHGALNPTTLKVVQGYTADLVSGLAADASAKLKGAVQRAFLGGQTLHETVVAVGHALEGGKFSGVFTDIGDRAMKVAVNEVLRVHSISAQARLVDLASRNPKIKKQWHHIFAAKVPRLTHIAASGQVVAVDKPFIVAGEELMFPRDPNGRPDNTIFCHCLSLPYIDDDDLFATEADREVLANAGIVLKVAA